MTTTEQCIDHLIKRVPGVHAIALCGSHRQGIADDFSDRDVWSLCDNRQPISDHLAVTEFLPTGTRHEILFEGRDDTLTDHTVLNVLTDTEILNLKFLHVSVLTDFCRQPVSLDPQYLEDLENFTSMRRLHDPAGLIARHQRRLTRHARNIADPLLTQILSRYGSTYWRSVYQGVLRTEEHAWRHLATHLIELLAWAAFIESGELPPPRKWLFSPRLLHSRPQGPALSALLDQVQHVRATETDTVLDFYRSLAETEDAVFTDTQQTMGMWWRAVFSQRLPNLARHLDRDDLNAYVARAPRPRSTR
ncbi:hypothetical protein OHA84_36880 [Streptomyces sp. NBC_00513]|uniref:hypothetical protein n=1 Tax=unclassified Streptomyces TaxID=2593676 RepID=UPI0022554610|nr:hypothetical protein [Streptomyces sp. NBC_00424]MCX5078649.1 hypothetical protein [Streptomyces sp. NBC_00424]WUD39092.1 hypothetical protein OHA84_00420 [Streptomyces sp. NBC_00513]WUD45637.1 hypothetical protein OHA84_36880 [Streptomyces sp. NBC_00513]